MADYKTMAGDMALMEALQALDTKEKHVAELTQKIAELNAQLQAAPSNHGNSDLQVKELIKVNHQWDLEYRELEDKHRTSQQENEAVIAQLKETKDYLSNEIDCLNREIGKRPSQDLQKEINGLKKELLQKERIIASLKQRNSTVEEQLSRGGAGRDGRRLRQLEEENALLKQQVTVYKDDFEAECRDREHLVDEKQSLTLRYEAELTSYKLQLDRCRTELQHYTTEATRLQQQLRLKNQYEEDQFKKHLESRGYVSRGGVNGGLPPLDPYVEHDPPSHPMTNGTTSPRPVPKTTAMVSGSNIRTLFPKNNGYIMQNGGVVPLPISKARVEIDGQYSQRANYRTPEIETTPIVASKGKHKCPRCARRFDKNSDCETHKIRCIS